MYDDVEKWLSVLKNCECLTEQDVKRLCEMVQACRCSNVRHVKFWSRKQIYSQFHARLLSAVMFMVNFTT